MTGTIEEAEAFMKPYVVAILSVCWVLLASCTESYTPEKPAEATTLTQKIAPSLSTPATKEEDGWCEEHRTPEALCPVCTLPGSSCEEKALLDPEVQSCDVSPAPALFR